MGELTARFRASRVLALVTGLTLSLAGAMLSAQDATDDGFVGNKVSKIYHKATCEAAKKITEKNQETFNSADEAKINQYKPCPICKPAGVSAPKTQAKKKTETGDVKPDDDGEMKAEKAMPPPKAKKVASKKTTSTAPKTEGPAGGEMKADGSAKADASMLPKSKTKKSTNAKSNAKKTDVAASPKLAAKSAEAEKGLKFSEEIAPILAGNCVRCHNAQQKRGGFDLSNFQKLIGGSAKRKVIVSGKPDESELVLRIRGDSEGPKMPPGQVNLGPEAIAKIEEWIKAGAILNAGIDPVANLDAIAPSAETRRRKELAKLSPEERDKKLEEAGTERWKKASSKSTPTITSGPNFLVFSNLPPDRADRLMKALDTQKKTLAQILGPPSNNAINGAEKISVYVFNDLASYVEFVRSVESRELEQGIEAHGKLDVEHPYLVAADPLNGGVETLSAATTGTAKKSSKSKKAQVADEVHEGPDRSLPGLLTEQLGVSATNASGKPPRWLSYGLGAFLASKVDPPGSGYYRKLRETTAEKYQQGWESKANEALGGEGDPETIRAIGFSLCEWQASAIPRFFPTFTRGMLQGGEKLDDVIQGCFGNQTTRQIFLNQWGSYIASRSRRR